MPKETKIARSRTILVVENEVLIRLPIASYLRDCGYRVIEAVDPKEAMAVLRDPGYSIDIVFAATELPGEMDGFALCQWVRTNMPGVKTMLTGTPRRAAAMAGELCEEGPHKKRPYSTYLIEDRIRRLLATKRSDTR